MNVICTLLFSSLFPLPSSLLILLMQMDFPLLNGRANEK